MYSVDSKMGVIEMIDRLNANSKVGIVRIGHYSDSQWNNEVVTLITNRYTNMHTIGVHNYDD